MNAPLPQGAARVKGLYDELVADRQSVATAPPASDLGLVGEIAAILNSEARTLDARGFDRWLTLWEVDATYWVPLATGGHPGTDQALFLDDRRRLVERVWRMSDRSAWALWPPAETVRSIGGVEAWRVTELADAAPAPRGDEEVLAASAIHIQYVRGEKAFSLAGRQVHRLRRTAEGWRLRRKILLLPELSAGSAHLGWLL